MGLCLQRYLGPTSSLPAGEWTQPDRDLPALVVAVVACRSCGGIDHLDSRYSVGPTGIVTPEYVCPTTTCGQGRQWLVLESWDP